MQEIYILAKHLKLINHLNEKKRGIVNARNKCLQAANKFNPKYLAFIDDDVKLDRNSGIYGSVIAPTYGEVDNHSKSNTQQIRYIGGVDISIVHGCKDDNNNEIAVSGLVIMG